MAGASAPAVLFGVSSFSGFAASGSSPGGATRRSDSTLVSRAFSFLRPLPPFLLQFVDCAGLPRLTSWIGAASPGGLFLAARVT